MFSSMSEDDEARRQQEINMFAAMAQGDAAEFNSATFDAAAFSDDQQDSNEGGSRELFVQAALGADPTGTFNLQEDGASTPSSSSVAKNYNLEAAAAAFADGEDNGSHISTADGPAAGQRLFMSPNRPSTQADNFPKLAPRTPMHTQQMLLPKPLFFGCQLPPRVVKEAREIVQSFPADRPYPPEVRNLLSAIKAYGHGLDLLQEDSKPSPYVSLFCPKWSVVLPPWTESDPTSGEGGKEDPGDDSNIASTPPSDNAEGTPSKTASGNTSTNETRTPSTPDTVSELSERDMFSMWAQGNDSAIGSPDNKGLQSSTLQRENSTGSSSASIQRDSVTETEIMSDRDLFSQWARGESFRENGSTRNLLGKSTKSIVSDGNVNRRSLSQSAEKKGKDESVAKAGSINFLNSGTFMNLPMQDDSDDDELVVSELKKKVGVNEHLNAALAYLEEDQNDVRNAGENSALEESNNRLAQVPLTHDGGRPLTNHELMNGVAPLFGSDDSTLPTEADLGIHETRDEQQRSREQRRNQGIIENCCPQNIFGLISCPDPSMNPHDNHSWNSRATPPTHPRIHPAADFQPLGVPRTVAHAKLGVLPTQDLPSKPQVEPRSNEKSLSAPTGSNPPSSGASIASKAPHLVDKKFDPRQRYGWWNVPDHDDLSTEPASAIEGAGNGNEDTLDLSENQEEQPPLQLPPLTHASTNVLVQTKLEPNPEKLHEQNRPLSQLHPATVYAQSLPFLSDRPPSYRYLQIDTQAVGFLGLGGEIEPLFCSLAIYHIETIAPGTTKDPSLAPIPDLQRCGKVTETLNFDVVSDPSVEKHCHRALWPYTSESDDDKLQGTRCGVFPLPSNLNIYNLYAVLVVQKVVSEGSDFEIYLRPGKSANNGDAGGSDAPLNIDILRNRAEKAAKQQGKFIMPFAFGVAPLLQVFGADVPVVPSSRAVQIPLFRFSAGLGDRQIIDHIMVMLYPRCVVFAFVVKPRTNEISRPIQERTIKHLELEAQPLLRTEELLCWS